MPRILQQNVVILTVVLSFFALSFASSAKSAQTSKKSAKTAPTPPKKTAKATPTPSKNAKAKATPTPKNSKTTTAKSKTADKKTTNSKTSAKTTSKDKNTKGKTTAKTKESSSKTAASKSNSKTADKKSTASKSTTTKTAAKNSKTTPTTKKAIADKRTTTKAPVKENTKPKTTAKTPVKTEETISANAPQIIVTDLSARIRSQAKSTAPELTRPKLGTILLVAEKTPAWYRVQFTSGSKITNGWISANSVNDLNSTGRDQLYRQIADRYYKNDGMDFATASALYEFLNKADDELNDSDTAELDLKKLMALKSALKAIPVGQSDVNPYQEFIKGNQKNVVYSEPAGAWYVNSNLFWDLHTKYEKSPLADQIAWEGAQNPLPGECEGYVNCYLFYGRMTSAEYLRLHPTGKKNTEALINLTNLLEPIVVGLNGGNSVYSGPTDMTDRAEFYNLLAELRTIVSRLPLTEKEKTLQQLRKIAEGFR